MKRCCENCFYSRENNETSVACHRYPPAIVKAEALNVTTYFPLLLRDNWCGEWKIKSKTGYGSIKN